MPFDHDKAQRAEDFFPTFLRHWKGEWAGQPFELQPWQRKMVRDLFGTVTDEGLRQYLTAYIEVPRKNGKSTWCAGLALFLLLADDEPGAEIYSCAADRDQAAIVFEDARQMVEQHPALSKRCEVYRRSIVVPRTGSSYKVLSADAPTKHGKNAHAIIFDELHAQPNSELWDVMSTSTGSRRQPLLVAITTAGYDRESICYKQHEYAQRILAGDVKNPRFYPVIYGAETDEDWTDPAVWAAANPNYGVSVKAGYLEQKCAEAQDMPSSENAFRRLHLNQWTEQNVRWMNMDRWDACGGVVDFVELAGKDCYGGLDLSTTTDITALALVFPRSGGFSVALWAWIPEEKLRERSKRDKVDYREWVRRGYIETTPGNIIDYDRIRARINGLGKKFRIREIAIDRWNATQITTQLDGDGFTVFPFGQGYASMSAPMKELEKLVLGQQIRHGGNPVLRWMASNVAAQTDAAGNIKPAKDKSADRIDGIVATIMGLDRAGMHKEISVNVWAV